MSDLILTTYDWVPEPPRGLVRDLRVRWALEEAGLPYRLPDAAACAAHARGRAGQLDQLSAFLGAPRSAT